MFKALLVTVLVLGSAVFFVRNLSKTIRLILAGGKVDLMDRLADRVGNVLRYVMGHKKVLEDRRAGLMHLGFFYGFLVLQFGHGEHLVHGMTAFMNHPVDLSLLPAPLHQVFLFSQDATAGLVVVLTVYALGRRWLHLIPRLEPRSLDAEIILYFIGALYATMFLYTSTEVAMGGPSGWFRPFAGGLSMAFGFMPAEMKMLFHEVGYWSHLVVFLAFLNYLPFSKHAHTMAAVPNIFFHRNTPRGKPGPIDFDTAESYGVSKVTDLSWKELLDTFGCTECGRCNSVCPAHLTGKPLQPRKVLHDIKENLLNNAGAIRLAANGAGNGEAAPPELLPLLLKDAVARNGEEGPIHVDALGTYSSGGQIHVDEAWACTTCGACMEICPVLIESVPATLMDLRRNLVMMDADIPPEMANTFKNLEGQQNPWGVPSAEREKWTDGLDVPLMKDKKKVDVLFWVGCAGSTDDRAKKTQRALVQVMKASGVDFAILGCEEKCTGDPARRMGNEYLFQQSCTDNQAVLAKYEFNEIVTSCPHCLNSLGNDYQDYGAPAYKVRHHTELLAQLLDQKKPAEKVAFHDPCYLGRYNNVYNAPRNALRVLNNVEVVEMERNRELSFCCGAGGGRIFMEEHIGKRVNVERTEQALATGASTVAVGCPFCMTMITDGTKAKGVEETVKVKDVAELVAARLDVPTS